MAPSGTSNGPVSGRKAAKGIFAGGVTGGLEICITYPTEYVKTLLQLDQKLGSARKYSGIIDCASKTYRAHGFFGMYRGLSVLIYGSIPKSAVRFGAFEEFKRHFVDDNGRLSRGASLICGLGAGVSEAILAVTPMETIKVKFIDDRNSPNPKYRGFFHGVREIIRSNGVGGIYKGLTATILKQGSNQAIRFFVMESLRNWWKGNDHNAQVPKLIVGCFGALAGAASVFGNTPIDVVKSRMQGLEAHKYRSTWHCAMVTWREEGFRGFYKGTIPRLSRVCLDVGITFMIYDSIMEWIDQIFSEK